MENCTQFWLQQSHFIPSCIHHFCSPRNMPHNSGMHLLADSRSWTCSALFHKLHDSHPALKHLSYSKRFAILNLNSLEIRQLRSDLTSLLQNCNNLVCINNCDQFIIFQYSAFHLLINTRSSGARLVSSNGRMSILSNNFFLLSKQFMEFSSIWY